MTSRYPRLHRRGDVTSHTPPPGVCTPRRARVQGALPFRFVPALVQLLGFPPAVSYAAGAWISIVAMVVLSEAYVRLVLDAGALAEAYELMG